MNVNDRISAIRARAEQRHGPDFEERVRRRIAAELPEDDEGDDFQPWVWAILNDEVERAVKDQLTAAEQRIQELEKAQSHADCHDLVCNGDRRYPRSEKGHSCGCRGRDTAYTQWRAAEQRIAQLETFLKKWVHHSHLQTFEDRERFRVELSALLTEGSDR